MCNDRTNKCTFEKIQDMTTATELKTNTLWWIWSIMNI